VYKGTADLDTGPGARWRAAVEDTTGEILVAGGAPAQALYSSSFGSASLGNQTVWGGAPISYLQPVASPEVGVAPFAKWTVVVPVEAFLEMLRRGGFDVGSNVVAAKLDDGRGRRRAELVVNSDGGATRVPATQVRSILNRWAPQLYPGSFPVVTPKGNRYPQTILSYSFDVEVQAAPLRTKPGFGWIADVPATGSVVFSGEGWGHGVGMSQWGARIMADQGASYSQILSHYYGGLQPTPAGDLIPELVRVGLVAGRPSVGVEIVGPVSLEVNGVPAGAMANGTWLFHADGDQLIRTTPATSRAAMELFRRPWPR
jgi:stage II sporulation protein D